MSAATTPPSRARPTRVAPAVAAAAEGADGWPVPIGTAAERAGVSPRMVRHYEALGLLQGVARTDGGYRQYTQADVHTLRFIRRARDLGFSMEEIATLLGLWQDQRRHAVHAAVAAAAGGLLPGGWAAGLSDPG